MVHIILTCTMSGCWDSKGGESAREGRRGEGLGNCEEEATVGPESGEGPLSAGLVLEERSAARVAGLVRWGPAHCGGLVRPGDEILAVNDRPLAPSDVAAALEQSRGEIIGRCCWVRVRRGDSGLNPKP